MAFSQKTIAVVFDFDETLAPDSTSGFLESRGVDVPKFWQEVGEMCRQGWDPVPAYLFHMIEESRARGGNDSFSRILFADWGAKLPLFPGVVGAFQALKKHTREINPQVSLEFYLVSSGIGDILRHTRIAKHFTEIWASEFHYDNKGGIDFPKNIISFTDKTRYLFQIQKGIIGEASRGSPFEVNRSVPRERLRVPFEQMIFVGDGHTDIPCFSLVKKSGGVALGVYDSSSQERWARAWGFVEEERVSNLAPADHRRNSALTQTLMMALSRMANSIALREREYQG